MAEWLASIPDVVWAALLASLLTLSGVLLANRDSRMRQTPELKHDASQRNREREMALRRDVYLRAAEAISRVQNMLMRLTDLSVSEQDFSASFCRDSSAMAQVQLVGANNTVQAISAFGPELSAAFLELSFRPCTHKRVSQIPHYVIQASKRWELESHSEGFGKPFCEYMA